ncbi:unnamed protein product [Cylindrotheca closterium]|uniref:Uncharacterized protein n=1 Tax=Cylindrotheca closterium TaxID=2856 RepID=A0AAD2CTL1_9STRA|nr:unnamed protein product [Cylindrotheca closterium]
MNTEEINDFDSMQQMGNASLSTIGSFEESLHDDNNFHNSCSVDSLDVLQPSTIDTIATNDNDSIGFEQNKTVRWAPSMTSERPYISRYDMSFEEAQRTWILADEKTKLMESHVADVKREKEGLPEEETCAFRGLDGLHNERAAETRNNIISCVQAVLNEQSHLRESNLVDPTQLALVSASFSGGSRQTALKRAEVDLQQAKEVYNDRTDTIIIGESNFCSSPKSVTSPSSNFGRPANTKHYTSSQQTRVMLRGGLV